MDSVTEEDPGREWDFSVDVMGHCFLCIIKLEPTQASSSWLSFDSSTNRSIQCLAQYLKLDLGNVYIGMGATIPPSLSKGNLCRLGVPLCQDCFSVNEDFSKLHGEMQEIELKITNCLKGIQQKLRSTVKGSSGNLENSDKNDSSKDDFLNMKEGLPFGMALRRELSQICSLKVSRDVSRGTCAEFIVKKTFPSNPSNLTTKNPSSQTSQPFKTEPTNETMIAVSDAEDPYVNFNVVDDSFSQLRPDGDPHSDISDDALISDVDDTDPQDIPNPEIGHRTAAEPDNGVVVCTRCYDEHRFKNCPYKIAASKIPGLGAIKAARLLKLREKFGKDNPVDKRRRKQNISEHKTKKRKARLCEKMERMNKILNNSLERPTPKKPPISIPIDKALLKFLDNAAIPTPLNSESNTENRQIQANFKKSHYTKGRVNTDADITEMSTICTTCLAQDQHHSEQKDCQYRSDKIQPRTKEFRVMVKSRLEKIREKYGMDNHIDNLGVYVRAQRQKERRMRNLK